MDIKKLQALVVDALEDIKAQDIRVYDTTQLTSLFDRLAIASGTSNRQTKALAASVRDKVKGNGGEIVSVEGEETGEWVLVDLGDMIVHIMQPAIRDYYRLEEIWGEKEVKLGAAKRTSKRTASAEEDEAPKKRGRHLTVNQTTTEAEEVPKKTPARKTATKTASKTEAKTATKTAAKSAMKTATKTAAKTATKTASKTAGTAAKAAAPRKTAAKSTTGTKIKVATRKAPAKKSAAKKAD